ncbi:TIR domain-containing protein [Rubinisphaera italica]|uniref:cAMP-activated global transcriptional regulator CRP n=1 Tax=Rubinisphaera italica TaxID=2527969 RepID=A0A5C5XN78_9PLAN|nr:TIR domain-containing protein [Rubinisphaera italica]TWT64410.1 cAMP-activated global transcriptional regulator CRP [Rubinisphaera italica]
MKERFEGDDGRRLLVESIRRQPVVEGDAGLAERLVAVCDLQEFKAGETLIADGGDDNTIHLIVQGRASVLVSGTEVAERQQGQHVGEMALIDPMQPRCAAVNAKTDVVVATVSEPEFTKLAQDYPRLWRMLALELADRLRQRNRLVRPANVRPVLFIGSSAEAIPVVNEVERQLAHANILPKKWTTSVFTPSEYPVDDLIAAISASDFGLLVLSPDDLVESRDEVLSAPRDNVIYEGGICTGELGRRRTLLLQPRGVDIKIPSDLFGLNPITYSVGPEGDLAAALGPAVTEIQNVIGRLKTR